MRIYFDNYFIILSSGRLVMCVLFFLSLFLSADPLVVFDMHLLCSGFTSFSCCRRHRRRCHWCRRNNAENENFSLRWTRLSNGDLKQSVMHKIYEMKSKMKNGQWKYVKLIHCLFSVQLYSVCTERIQNIRHQNIRCGTADPTNRMRVRARVRRLQTPKRE